MTTEKQKQGATAVGSGGVLEKIKKAKLSPRQAEILQLCGNGETDKAIANLLGISENTVSNHFCKIYDRLKANSRAHAVRIFFQKAG